MGKIKTIQKSRKECKCGKCGNVIPVGSKYLRGQLNFNPDIIRCCKCGLQSWEVTTSEYQLNAGAIVYNWKTDHGLGEDTPDVLVRELEQIRDELQERLDNMPENLQNSETAELLQSRIDGLEGAISDLESIDIDTVKRDALEEVFEDSDHKDCDDISSNEKEDWESLDEYFHQSLNEEIDNALSNIEV